MLRRLRPQFRVWHQLVTGVIFALVSIRRLLFRRRLGLRSPWLLDERLFARVETGQLQRIDRGSLNDGLRVQLLHLMHVLLVAKAVASLVCATCQFRRRQAPSVVYDTLVCLQRASRRGLL